MTLLLFYEFIECIENKKIKPNTAFRMRCCGLPKVKEVEVNIVFWLF